MSADRSVSVLYDTCTLIQEITGTRSYLQVRSRCLSSIVYNACQVSGGRCPVSFPNPAGLQTVNGLRPFLWRHWGKMLKFLWIGFPTSGSDPVRRIRGLNNRKGFWGIFYYKYNKEPPKPEPCLRGPYMGFLEIHRSQRHRCRGP